MGWAVGFDSSWGRDVGYGVPAVCDHPVCSETIDRGLAHVCGSDPYGGDEGCGLFFCSAHMRMKDSEVDESRSVSVCEACFDEVEPFQPKPDVAEWVRWKLEDSSWAKWREEHPEQVREMEASLVP